MAKDVLITGNSRVFLIDGRASPDKTPSYESCMRMMGVSQGFGDVERVECPDPSEYSSFNEVTEIRGSEERATTSLSGRYMMNLKSTLLDLATKGCAVDIQLHMGTCTDPSSFNTFKKALVLENASLTSYSTDDLGALGSGDNASVDESADISAENMYEVLPLGFGIKAGSIITNEIVDVVMCDVVSCGDCEEESDGKQKIYGLSIAAGGSPSTPADVVFSIDGGTTWYAHDVDTLGAAEDPDAIDCVGDYITVVSNASGGFHYALKSELDGDIDPSFTEVTTGVVAASEPNAIFSLGTYAFIVGDSGYVYDTSDITAGVSVVDAGTATSNALNAVHALSEEFAVAVGDNGAIIFTETGDSWTSIAGPVGINVDLNTVWVKSETEWWIGTDTGYLYYTLDQGDSWTEKSFTGSGSGSVHDVVFVTDSVAYLAHATATPAGRILRSYDGGHSWQVLPEGTGSLPANDRINALGYSGDANFIVGGGLDDDGSDGIMIVGSA